MGHVGLRRRPCGRPSRREPRPEWSGLGRLALLGLALAGYALTSLIGRSGLPLLLELLIGVLVLIIVSGVIGVVSVLVGGSSGSSSDVGAMRSLYWSHLVNPSLNVFGWMLLYLGFGWIAFQLTGTSARIGRSSPCLPRASGFTGHGSRVSSFPGRRCAGSAITSFPASRGCRTSVHTLRPSRSVGISMSSTSPRSAASSRRPGAEAMFQPKGEMMQVVLNSADLAVKPEDFLGPAEARWKAFRDGAGSPSQPGHTIVYGRWSIDGSLVAGRPVSCAAHRHGRGHSGPVMAISKRQRPSCLGS